MENITLPFLKFSAKLRKQNNIVDIFDTFDKARSILIFMPDKLEDFGIARKYVNKIMADFPKANFQVVIRESYRSLLDGVIEYGIVFVAEKEVGIFGLPKKKLKQKIFTKKHDIVIDLNNEFHLLSTFLCRISDAALKICLDNEDRELFYNFYLRTNVQEKLEKKYEKLVYYLKNFVEN